MTTWAAPEVIDYTAGGDTVYEAVDALDLNQDDIYSKLNYLNTNMTATDDIVYLDSYADFDAALTAIGVSEVVLVANEAIVLTTGTTIPSTLTVWAGPKCTIDLSDYNLTIDGGFMADNRTVFVCSGSGTLNFATGQEVRSGWFANFGDMITLLGSNTTSVVISRSFTTTENLSFPSTTTLVWLSPNCLLTMGSASHTLTVAGKIMAGGFKIIDNSVGGTLSLPTYPYNNAWIGNTDSCQHSTFVMAPGNGAAMVITWASTNLTLSGATTDWSNAIPAGSLVLGVFSRVTTAITSGGTSWSIGTTTKPTLWGTGLSKSDNTTQDIENYTSPFTLESVIAPLYAASATTIRVTSNSSTFSAGVIRIYVAYIALTPPTT